jgi:hypothetical protein
LVTVHKGSSGPLSVVLKAGIEVELTLTWPECGSTAILGISTLETDPPSS